MPERGFMDTRVLPCKDCRPHKYQDAHYGLNNRVMNQTMTTTGSPNKYRCTICGKEKEGGNQ